MERPDDWNYPGRAQVDSWSYERGITRHILDQVEVKEIIEGLSTEDEIEEILSWFWEKYALDHRTLPTNVVSRTLRRSRLLCMTGTVLQAESHSRKED